jgi:hypothetical protein
MLIGRPFCVWCRLLAYGQGRLSSEEVAAVRRLARVGLLAALEWAACEAPSHANAHGEARSAADRAAS